MRSLVFASIICLVAFAVISDFAHDSGSLFSDAERERLTQHPANLAFISQAKPHKPVPTGAHFRVDEFHLQGNTILNGFCDYGHIMRHENEWAGALTPFPPAVADS